jgi:hypothetical protein
VPFAVFGGTGFVGRRIVSGDELLRMSDRKLQTASPIA